MFQEEKLKDVPILVLANKKDLPGAQTVGQINTALDLQKTKQTYNILASNALTGDGVLDGLQWFSMEMKKKDN